MLTMAKLPPDALDRLRKVEALLRRPGTLGEGLAAAAARERIYRTHGLEVPPLGQEPARDGDRPMPRATPEWARAAAARQEARRAEQARQEAEAQRTYRARAEAKAKADAAFLRRPGCLNLEAILRVHGLATIGYLAQRLGQKQHSVRALISRMRKAGAPISRTSAGMYKWGA